MSVCDSIRRMAPADRIERIMRQIREYSDLHNMDGTETGDLLADVYTELELLESVLTTDS